MVKKIQKENIENSGNRAEKIKVVEKPAELPTLKIKNEREIAMDLATKVYEKFSKLVKSIVLFGSVAKNTSTEGSDIDIIVIVDDAVVLWDAELIAWYREELGKILGANPYAKSLHVNTVRLTTWWQDLLRGDPVVINVLRYGEAIIDFGGFFNPLKVLLQQGKIRSTPEAVFTALQRAPAHLARSKDAEIGAVEGVYWAMVDSAHAALMAAGKLPPSPEHVPIMLKETFADAGMLKMKYVVWYRDLYDLYRKIMHRQIRDLRGADIDSWQDKADEFMGEMAELVKKIVSQNK